MVSTRVTKKRLPPAERRAEILSAAVSLAQQEGLEALTLRRIAEELSVARGLIHHYFPTIDDLVCEAFALATSADIDNRFAETMDAPDAAARVWRLLDGFAISDRLPVANLWVDAWNLGRTNPRIYRELQRQNAYWQERFAEILAQGKAEGVFTLDDCGVAATQIAMLTDGLSIYSYYGSPYESEVIRDFTKTTIERLLGLRLDDFQ